jgi:hypothetical protein
MKQRAIAMSRYLIHFCSGCTPATRPIPSPRKRFPISTAWMMNSHENAPPIIVRPSVCE